MLQNQYNKFKFALTKSEKRHIGSTTCYTCSYSKGITRYCKNASDQFNYDCFFSS